jgi:hypothetical protein
VFLAKASTRYQADSAKVATVLGLSFLKCAQLGRSVDNDDNGDILLSHERCPAKTNTQETPERG